MKQLYSLIAVIDLDALPTDCIDINVHVKNVRDNIVTNDTEKFIRKVYDELCVAVPTWGTPSSIEWGGSTDKTLQLTLRWWK